MLQMEFRLAELENPVRQHGIQLGQVADRKADVDELRRASLVMRGRATGGGSSLNWTGQGRYSCMSTDPQTNNALSRWESRLCSTLSPGLSRRDAGRVLSRSRTYSQTEPDDEMLRILEAMGILALLTRQTPMEIAEEREPFQEMLDLHQQFSDEAQQKMLAMSTSWSRGLLDCPRRSKPGLMHRRLQDC